jgi:predicted dehydrogenase
MPPLRVSIIGVGLSLKTFHYPLIQALPEQYVLHSVLERSGKETAREVVGQEVKVVTTLEEVVGDQEVDLVSAGSHCYRRRVALGWMV